MPLRVVIDTSSLVSYLLSGGKIMRSIIAAWRAAEINLLFSPQTLAELESVIARSEIQQYSAVPLASLVNGLYQFSLHVPGTLALDGVCRDPKDDKFIACAIEGLADYLVSSDRDLLEIGRFRHVCILNPGQFLAVLQLARMSVDALRSEYSLSALKTILTGLCLDTETKGKLLRVIALLSVE